MSINKMGDGFLVFFRFTDKIFKTNNRFRVTITSSTGKTIKIDSVSSADLDDKYATIEIDDSAGTIILDYIIQRNDNAILISKGYPKIKYNDITKKLKILEFKPDEEAIALKLTEIKDSHFNLDLIPTTGFLLSKSNR